MRSKINIIKATILFIACIFTIGSRAQNPEELLTKANKLYNESQYDSAAVVYEDIINQGYSSATLYYNMGNTYYKMKKYPLSILYYEKSLKLDPNNEDAKHNIDIANMFISDKIDPIPELFIKKWWNDISNIFSINTWAIITLIILALLLVSIFLYLTSRTRGLRKSMFFIGIIMVVLVTLTFSISIKKYNHIKNHDGGIVITSTITVKSSPSQGSVDLFVLHEGSKVKILDHTDNWDKIKIANGSIGWIPSSTIIKY